MHGYICIGFYGNNHFLACDNDKTVQEQVHRNSVVLINPILLSYDMYTHMQVENNDWGLSAGSAIFPTPLEQSLGIKALLKGQTPI